MDPSSTPRRQKTKYRKYLRDGISPIPRQTLWRHKKKQENNGSSTSHSSPLPSNHHSLIRSSTSHAANATLSSSPPSAVQSSYSAVQSSFSPLHVMQSSSPVHASLPLLDGSPPPSLPGHLPSTSPPSHADSPPLESPFSPFSSPASSREQSPSLILSDGNLLPPTLLNSPSPSLNSSCENSPSFSSSSTEGSPLLLSHGEPTSPPSSPRSSTEDIPSQSRDSSCDFVNILHDPHLFTPLYPGAVITTCGAICVIMQFCQANKLSYTAIGELLKLLDLLCPSQHQLPKTFHTFQKFFKQFQSAKEHIRVCTKCMERTCSCTSPSSSDHADLVNLNIRKPLQSVISRNWESLLPAGERDNQIRDVWDASILKQLSSPGYHFADKSNLALSLFTDGVPLYKSSQISMWPVYLTIQNLPPKIRTYGENTILCAIWIGPAKPSMNLLLHPVVDSLQKLEQSGLTINTSSGDHVVYAKVVFAVFDLPAKAAVLCAKQYNGEYGCSVCLHPGKRLPSNARVYMPDSVYPERTHLQIVDAASRAEQSNTPEKGIMGRSPLTPILDLVTSIPVDYMHCVLEGVTRALMRFWFDSKNHSAPYYIGRYLQQLDHELIKQRPPKEFSRPPRSISKHFKYWKATELRQWLLYYSLPLLKGVLPSLYWHHYSLLVCAIHIILGNNISHSQIDAAEQMLKDFHVLLPELYGESSCTANAHYLTHLAKYVRLWGPLWTHSAFGFESKNGQLKYLFHGRKDIVHQLLFNIDVSYTLQQVHKQLLQSESERALEYVTHLYRKTQTSNMIPLDCTVDSHVYIVGQRKLVKPSTEQSTTLGSSANIEVFSRLFKGGALYCTTSYSRGTKRDNSKCSYYDQSSGSVFFGKIELFTSAPKPCVLLRQLQPTQQTLLQRAGHPCRDVLKTYKQVDLLNCHIIPVDLTVHSPLIAVTFDCIVSKLVFLSVSGNHYCVVQPNTIEHN